MSAGPMQIIILIISSAFTDSHVGGGDDAFQKPHKY